ncbi:MAG: molybdopterin molybdotransferase MoeA [Candidatus Omnitrophota bacterium]|nr:molybdopterin molybdotransferase MoeA [Candidatus Omnitrophota bacterium]
MIKVDEALKIILKSIKPLGSEAVKLTSILGRVLADDIYADSCIPAFDNSAMDGYAVRAIDTHGSSQDKPRILDVIEDLKAGYLAKNTIRHNQAIRIMTGAVMPRGADSVVVVEETQKLGKNKVEIFAPIKQGENVRLKGEDIEKGELIIAKGILLSAGHIGVLASLGRQYIKVTRKPKIAILATGDELVDVGKKLKPGKIRSSNTYTLYAQILKSGGIPKNLGIAKDRCSELEAKIKKGLDCDVIISSGGVSVGDYDFVKHVLRKIGTHIKFWKVAMRPGKPLVFGMIKGIPVFGLPGNPVSSMVSFEIFAIPAILKMLGQDISNKKEVKAILEEGVKKKKGLRYFLRASTIWKHDSYYTRTTGPQGSGILKSMALANSLIILPEEEEKVEKGVRVTVRFLD